jgi:hypothetical protein
MPPQFPRSSSRRHDGAVVHNEARLDPQFTNAARNARSADCHTSRGRHSNEALRAFPAMDVDSQTGDLDEE